MISTAGHGDNMLVCATLFLYMKILGHSYVCVMLMPLTWGLRQILRSVLWCSTRNSHPAFLASAWFIGIETGMQEWIPIVLYRSYYMVVSQNKGTPI